MCKSKRCVINRNILLRKWIKKLKKMIDERELMYEKKIEDLYSEIDALKERLEENEASDCR